MPDAGDRQREATQTWVARHPTHTSIVVWGDLVERVRVSTWTKGQFGTIHRYRLPLYTSHEVAYPVIFDNPDDGTNPQSLQNVITLLRSSDKERTDA
jgi:hypothetical protein